MLIFMLFYVQKKPLSQFERDRIQYEGTSRTYQILHSQLSLDDPIATTLRNRLNIPAEIAEIFL